MVKSHYALSAAIMCITLLAGCASSPVQQNNENTSASAESNEDLFAKKQECQKYLSSIQKNLEKRDEELSSYTSPQKWTTGYSYLEKVFYSKKANSCLYKWETYLITQRGSEQSRSGDAFYLDDALTGQTVVAVFATWGQNDFHDKEIDFEEKVKPYEE
jgi:outer membrane murein-binding lipoprotein Lpp